MTDWIVAIGTICALLLAVWQMRENAKLARKDNSIEMWMEYLRCGLANPDLGETRIALTYLKIKGVDELVSGDTLDTQRYLWFLTVMLDAAENLYLNNYTALWERTIRQNIEYHREALALLWNEESEFYNSKFGNIVRQVIDGS